MPSSFITSAPSAQSYLNIPALISTAEIFNVDAIHPGYGFLAENGDFAQMVIEHGVTFIGPRPEHIRVMGDKIVAKETMRRLGLPGVPGPGGPVVMPQPVPTPMDRKTGVKKD